MTRPARAAPTAMGTILFPLLPLSVGHSVAIIFKQGKWWALIGKSTPTNIKRFFAPIEVSLHLKVHDLQSNIDFLVSGRTVKFDFFVGVALVGTLQTNVSIQDLVGSSVR